MPGRMHGAKEKWKAFLPTDQQLDQPKEESMRAIVLIAAVSSLFLGGMTLLSPRDAGSQQIQAAPGVDVSTLGKAIDAKSLPETEVFDLY